MPLRIMTWNILRDDGHGGWPDRADALAQAIAREAPDVVALQEALPHQLRDLLARLPAYACVPGSANGVGEHPAILHRPLRARLVRDGCVWLSETPDVPQSRSWGNDIARCATWALFETDEGAITVVNSHFDHRSARFREKAAKLLRDMFPDATLVGDFNASPGSTPHRLLTARHRDAIPAKGFETMQGDDGVPDVRLDDILLPPGLDARRPRRVDARAAGEPASDHRALMADLEARPIGRGDAQKR